MGVLPISVWYQPSLGSLWQLDRPIFPLWNKTKLALDRNWQYQHDCAYHFMKGFQSSCWKVNRDRNGHSIFERLPSVYYHCDMTTALTYLIWLKTNIQVWFLIRSIGKMCIFTFWRPLIQFDIGHLSGCPWFLGINRHHWALGVICVLFHKYKEK